MAVTKITEKTVASALKDGAHFLVTQPETVDGSPTEALRRVPISMVREDLEGQMEETYAKKTVTDTLTEDVSELFSALLLLDDIPDTVQTLQRNEAGKVSGIVHTSTAAGGGVVRTDSYVFSDGAVVETRTLASGESLTITVNKATKATTLVYAAA